MQLQSPSSGEFGPPAKTSLETTQRSTNKKNPQVKLFVTELQVFVSPNDIITYSHFLHARQKASHTHTHTNIPCSSLVLRITSILIAWRSSAHYKRSLITIIIIIRVEILTHAAAPIGSRLQSFQPCGALIRCEKIETNEPAHQSNDCYYHYNYVT